ncbi:MAG: (d)CMP kinase [Syntrophales bacterium]
MGKKLVITIDGPAGAGKSTAGKALASRLSYIYLGTGDLYRAVAYTMANKGISTDNEARLSNLLRETDITLKNVSDHLRVFVNNEDITDKIMTERIGLLASKASAIPLVRSKLLSIQREAGEEGGIIAEGRDMGTVVFPDADLKFFLDASAGERARRRYSELAMKGLNSNYQEVERDLLIRDKQDRERKIASLQTPEDAVVIDSTNMTVYEVVERMAIIASHMS